MKRLLCFLLIGSATACTPEQERDFFLDGCRTLKVSGNNVGVRLVDMDLALVRMSGVDSALAEASLEQEAGHISILGDAIGIELGCPNLREIELLGSVAVDLGSAHLALERVAVYGASAVAGSHLSTSDLDLRASGQAAVSLTGLEVGEMQLLAAGDSAITLVGQAAELTLDATGRTGVDLSALRVQTVRLEASGDSRVQTWATAHLDANARGSAAVVYTGNPDLNVNAEPPASITPGS